MPRASEVIEPPASAGATPAEPDIGATPAEPDAGALHRAAARWLAANGRILPWRGVRDPYAVLVSEVMLQQTQAERVIPKYEAFMAAFPTLRGLAAAEPAAVIRQWAGMGYNRRAVHLSALARRVVTERGGRLPETAAELRELPGVGPYTAAAVACFAFGERVAALDTNVIRVLSRVAYGVNAPARADVAPLADALLPSDDSTITPADWHQALMDVGATVCGARRPDCPRCPFRGQCAAAPFLQPPGNAALARASIPYAPRQSKFHGSARYFRGRIVDFLRAQPGGSATEQEIEAAIRAAESASGAPSPRTARELIAALERDGLAQREGSRVRLP